jgi:hypothetical protein
MGNAVVRAGTLTSFAAMALLVAQGAAWAQSQPNESAQQNVKESHAYESLVCSNPGFRAKRIAQECGPITDPQLHQSCVASFDCGGQPKRATRMHKAPPSETIR